MQRSKFYKVKAKIKPLQHKTCISKDNTKDAKKERSKMIKEIYPDYYGAYFCPAIGANVAVNSNISLKKAASASSESAKSTQIALMLKEVIAKAELIYKDKPKDNVGQKSFSEIWVLAAIVKGVGYAKLTIGKYKADVKDSKAPFCQYCIKHISIHELKNKK